MNELYFPTGFNFATNFYWPTYFWTEEATTSTGTGVTMRPIYMDIVGARHAWR